MNTMPMAQAIQWGAMLAMDRGIKLVPNPVKMAFYQHQEMEAILNG